MKANERGSAMIEAAGVTLALFLCLSGLLTVTYLLFARAWIQYQSEQALYCLSESVPAATCRTRLEQNLKRFLPFGTTDGLVVHAHGGRWNVHFQWRTEWYTVNVRKQLSARKIVKNIKDLHS